MIYREYTVSYNMLENNALKRYVHISKFKLIYLIISAYLDKLLLSLVQITSNLGWSEHHFNSSEFQKIFSELIEALSELLIAFHCGKGPEAASSFMGLNITRNALLSMNHILYEMQQSAKKVCVVYLS